MAIFFLKHGVSERNYQIRFIALENVQKNVGTLQELAY